MIHWSFHWSFPQTPPLDGWLNWELTDWLAELRRSQPLPWPKVQRLSWLSSAEQGSANQVICWVYFAQDGGSFKIRLTTGLMSVWRTVGDTDSTAVFFKNDFWGMFAKQEFCAYTSICFVNFYICQCLKSLYISQYIAKYCIVATYPVPRFLPIHTPGVYCWQLRD